MGLGVGCVLTGSCGSEVDGISSVFVVESVPVSGEDVCADIVTVEATGEVGLGVPCGDLSVAVVGAMVEATPVLAVGVGGRNRSGGRVDRISVLT